MSWRGATRNEGAGVPGPDKGRRPDHHPQQRRGRGARRAGARLRPRSRRARRPHHRDLGKAVAVQIFGTNTGLSTDTSSVEFTGKPMEMRVSRDMLGRIFDGLGKPMDGYPESFSSAAPGRQWRAHQSGRAHVSQGLHPDGHLLHRRHEHADPRTEAAHLLGQRSSPQPSGRADHPPGARSSPPTSHSSWCSPPWASSTTWRGSSSIPSRQAAFLPMSSCSFPLPTTRPSRGSSRPGAR